MIFKIIRFFEREIYNDSVSLDDALEQQIRIKDEIDIFKESTKPQIKEKKALTFEKNPLRRLRRSQKVPGKWFWKFNINNINRHKEKYIL